MVLSETYHYAPGNNGKLWGGRSTEEIPALSAWSTKSLHSILISSIQQKFFYIVQDLYSYTHLQSQLDAL